MHTQIQNVLHAGREKHWRATRFKNMVAFVRCRGTLSNMVVSRHSQNTAPRCGSRHVGVFEHIGTTVHTRAFAVPNAKHAVELVAARRRKTELLGAPQRGGGQLFIHTRLKHNVLRLQVRLGLPQRLVIPTQG